MKSLFAFALAFCLIAPGADAQPPAAAAQAQIRAVNPSPFTRPDELVSVSWRALQARLPGLDPSRVRATVAGAEVPVQPVDENGDGQTDVLLLLAHFGPDEAKVFTVTPEAPSAAVPRAHAVHVEGRDDLAWESDRAAWRTYGQGLWSLETLVSSGIDVWAKRVPDLVVDRWYARGPGAYHQDIGEGADFFDVGPTLGGGGTGVWHGGALHRPANFAAHRVLADGPIRAIFELDYDTLDAAGMRVVQTKRITIDAGQHFYRDETTLRTDDADSLTYVVGLVEREGVVAAQRLNGPWAWLSLWGPLLRKNGGHGDLGTAVLLPAGNATRIGPADGHHAAFARARSGVPVVHYVGAGWTASGDFASVESWWAYLDRLGRRLAAPLQVELLP